MSFPYYQQRDTMDCGPTCLKMVAKYYGKNISLNTLRHRAQNSKQGVSMLGMSEAAEQIGFRTKGSKLSFDQLTKKVTLPAILHWEQNHFVILIPQRNKKNFITIADPAIGIIEITTTDFKKRWLQTSDVSIDIGIALLIEPTPMFYEQEDEREGKLGWRMLYKYLWEYKKYIVQLSFGLLIGSLLQLIFPFLTQSIVDTGIATHNINFIYIILVAQSALFMGSMVVDFIRNQILLFISTHINISILSDFWIKLMRLPISFFDTKQTGDIIQRINDHSRIELFLTGSTLTTLFSLLNFFVFSIVLLLYSWQVYLIFCVGSILYFLWIRVFLKQRRKLNYKQFAIASKENSATMQLIHGMQEIKLNNADSIRRWEWENLQASLFKLSFKSLTLSQYQQSGAFFINQGKNVLITFCVAKAVVDGQLTLGAMLAIQTIISQLNSPIEQLISFMQQAQDAKISLERLNEIHMLKDEEPKTKEFLTQMPENKFIQIHNLSFTYPGAGNETVLKNIFLTIPEGKITAIVGMSGSGKTTLVKILLRFYQNYKGEIKVGESSLENISPRFWRDQCGSVMQDGYIFSDSIAKNIAVNDEAPNYKRLLHACKVANISEFIESLPLTYNTQIGPEGNGISAGQKQRILIARAVYKDPQYLFFDEATNALDGNNEKAIMENMEIFFKGRTVVVVAHRLSTVKNADNIVMLNSGLIIEQGTHEQLINKKGEYYQLVKNQLDLDA